MAELIWTTEAPTEPGWYWMRRGGSEQIVKVGLSGGEFALFLAADEEGLCQSCGDEEWAGPIPAPKEADRG